jgi:NAD(P)-dependent dehydrogenase (short-subunit alcohol dehydrogenase family)
MGILLMLQTVLKLARYLVGFDDVVPQQGMELGVIITGCDSGFGQQLAFALARDRFTVFAGCLRAEAMDQFKGDMRIIPLLMDVRKDDQVKAVASLVNKWISIGDSKTPRYLHGVVNNAGIGHGGLVDWVELEDFQQDMDVNYFGIIRTVKAFLPMLKSQAKEYKLARVVNVVSMAGLVTGGFAAPYHGSKFAAEALSSCLRSELRNFNVQVVTINPSFHQTPLVTGMRQKVHEMWNRVPAWKQDDYGEEFFQQFVANGVDLPESFMWRARVVEQELLASIEQVRPPPQIIVGCDARFSFLVMRHCPVWLQDWMQQLAMKTAVKPKIMT